LKDGPVTTDDKKSGAPINLNSGRKRCLRLFFIICWQQLNQTIMYKTSKFSDGKNLHGAYKVKFQGKWLKSCAKLH
jgi:hypothetical protein